MVPIKAGFTVICLRKHNKILQIVFKKWDFPLFDDWKILFNDLIREYGRLFTMKINEYEGKSASMREKELHYLNEYTRLQGGAKRMDSLPYYTMLGGYFFLGTL